MKIEKKRLLVALLTQLAAGAVFAAGKFISLALLDKIHPGVTTEQQVRDLLGQSVHVIDYPARGQHDWEYEATDYGDFLKIWITFGNDGIVRDVSKMKPSGM
jgi:hypothetical protein